MFDGEEMRDTCIQGKFSRLREIVSARPNPCSTDV